QSGAPMRVFDTANGKEVQTLPQLDGDCLPIGFGPGADTLVVAGTGLVRVLDVTTGKELHRHQTAGHRREVAYVGFLPDGKRLLTGGADHRLWDIAAGKELWCCAGMAAYYFRTTALAPDGKSAAVMNWHTKTLGLIDTATGKPLRAIYKTDHVSSV